MKHLSEATRRGFATLCMLAILATAAALAQPARAAPAYVTPLVQGPKAAGQTEEPGTPFQKALHAAFEERQAQGLPVPTSVTFEHQTSTNPDHYLRQTGRTVINFDNPQQAGYERWPDFVVEEGLPEGAEGYVLAGDYTQAVYEGLAAQFPGIWEQYTFGQEPRTVTFEETFLITYPQDTAQARQADAASGGFSTATQDILLGFTYDGPEFDYVLEEKWEICVPFIGCWEMAYVKGGLELGWTLGLRLPTNVSLSVPEPMLQGCSYWPTSTIVPLDWDQAAFKGAGVPEAEGGNEFVLRFVFFLGLKIRIFGAEVLNWSLADVNFDRSRSFTTPFDPGNPFPIPELDLSPDETDLKWGWAFAWFGVGMRVKPEITASNRITADWQAVPGSDATGSGDLTYTRRNAAEQFGPLLAGDFGPTDHARVRLDYFRYWFERFSIQMGGYLQFEVFGIGAKTGSFDIAQFDLGDRPWLDVHAGTTRFVEASVLVTPGTLAPQVDAGPDQTTSEGATLNLPPATFRYCGGKPHSATIDWGDGAVEPGEVGYGAELGAVSGSHVYKDNGVYTVEVCVTNAASETGCDSFSATVHNLAPVLNAGPDQTVQEGTPVHLAPAAFSDAGTTDTHTATIDWGDGTIGPGTVVESNGSGTVSGSHTYTDNGPYTVKVCVTDDDGGLGCDELALTVENVAPTVDAGADQELGYYALLHLLSTFSDAGAADTHTATIDWGDGASEAGIVVESNGSGTVSGEHLYEGNGAFTVEVCVTDDDGGRTCDTLAVTVRSIRYAVLEDFVLYALDEVELERIAASEGWVGANRKIDLEEGHSETLDGGLRSAGRVKNEGIITITGDVVIREKLYDEGHITILGSLVEGVNVPMLTLPQPPACSRWREELEVKKGATVTLPSGTHCFKELDVDDRATLRLEAPIVIVVSKKLEVDGDARIVLASGSTREVAVWFLGEKKVEIDKRAEFWGTLFAPRAKVDFEDGSRLTGAVYAKEIEFDKGARFRYHLP